MTAQVDANDPGVVYIMHQPAGMTSFHEGKEWTITFGTTDTLGHRYNHPVSMNMAGGEFFDTLSIAMIEIDSLIMYQPKSVFQEGVFVIDETNVDDVVSVDSTMTIICFRKNAHAIPLLGQHVVSDLTVPPFPDGFLGVVSEINDLGDYFECICDGNWNDLTEFYISCIQSLTTSHRNSPKSHRPQRSVNPVYMDNKIEEISFDDSWNNLFKISTQKDLFGDSDNDIVSLTYSGEMNVYYKNEEKLFVQDSKSDMHTVHHVGIDIASGELNFSIKLQKEYPIPGFGFGEPIKKKGWTGTFQAGFFVYANAEASFTTTFPKYASVLHICPGLGLSGAVTRSSTSTDFQIGGVKMEAKGTFSPLRFKVELSIERKGQKKKSEETPSASQARNSLLNDDSANHDEAAAEDPEKNEATVQLKAGAELAIDFVHLHCKLTPFDISADYSDKDPEHLLKHYSYFAEANKVRIDLLKINGSVGANFKIDGGFISFEANTPPVEIDDAILTLVDIKNLPAIKAYRETKDNVGTDVEFWEKYWASKNSITSRLCELWVYNHNEKNWEGKLEEGWSEGRWGKDIDYVEMPTHMLVLRKGLHYSICPAIRYPLSWVGSDYLHVYTSPAEDEFVVPYIITTEDAKIDFSTAYGRMTVDPIAVKDCQDGLHTFEVGFQCAKNKEDLPYADKKKISFQNLEERMTQAVLHEPNAERWYRAYMIVDGLEDLAIYGEPKKFKTRNDECPSTQEATDITYTSAKLRALVNDQILSMFHASDQTKLGFVYNMGTTFGINPGRAGGKNGEVPFDSQYTYYHIYQNLYPDCDYSFAAFIIRPPADWSSPDKPDEEIDVPLRFHTKNPFNPITGDNFTTYFKTQITGEVNQWVLDHFYDEHYKGFEVYFRFGKTIESMKRVELDTPIGESTTVFAAIDNLDNDQDYVYQLCIDTNYPYGKRPYRGEIKTLHVPDAYKMDTWQPDPIGARTATFHGNMNEYIAQELTTMKEVKYYFAYSTDKNAVEQLKNPHKVAATRNGQNFTANASGLHYHSLHYCRIVAEGYDKDDIICANLIQFKGNVVEFETPEIFKPQSLTAYPTPKGLAFKVTMLPEAEEIINAGEEIVQMTVRYAQDRSQLKTPDNAHDVVMTWRCDKSDPADVKYYFCDSVPVLDVNHGYYYRAVSDYQGHISTLDSYNPTVVSVPTVEVTTGEATFDFDDARVDMSGHIQTSMPLHLERYQTDFICSFEYSTFEGYLPEDYEAVIVENDDPSDDVHDVQAQYNPATQDFQAMDVYMPSGDDDAVDYFYRGVFTQDTYPVDPKVYGQVLSCTVYYYDPGVMAYIAPRYRDAQGQWQRTALPADIQRKLDKRRAERAAAGRRFDGSSIRN